jgi:hypothetical protein
MSRKGARGKEEAPASFPRKVPFFCGGVGGRFLSRLSVAFDLLNLTKASRTS